MKKDYDFRFNPKEPSDKDIRKKMDFDALLQKVQQDSEESTPRVAPRLRLRWAYVGTAIAAGLVGALLLNPIWQGQPSPDYEQLAEAHFQSQPYIHPPLSPQPQFVKVSLDAMQGGSINISPNMRLNIPPSALALPNGDAANGEVTIKYRNMKDVGAYFMAGIPMTYDSLGQDYGFKQQNLLEIYAEQNGETLHLFPDSNMEVRLETQEMATPNAKKAIAQSVYYLDERARNWVYKGKTQAQFVPNNSSHTPLDPTTITAQYEQKMAELEAQYQQKKQALEQQLAIPPMPKAPQQYKPDLPTFDFDLALDAADEYAQYEGVEWQVEKNTDIVNQIAQIEWFEDEIKVQPLGNGKYRIRFDNGQQQYNLEATAVLSGAEYQQAMAQYESKKARIEEEIAQKQQQLQTQLTALANEQQQQREALQQQKAQQLATNNSPQNSTNTLIERAVEHIFTIHQLGIWNCEAATQIQGEPILVECYDTDGNKLEDKTLYVAQPQTSTLAKYYLANTAKIHWQEAAKMQVWLVTETGQIAVAYPDALQSINTENSPVRITLEVIPKPLEQEQDVYDALRLGQRF